jgi:hypothetical protein
LYWQRSNRAGRFRLQFCAWTALAEKMNTICRHWAALLKVLPRGRIVADCIGNDEIFSLTYLLPELLRKQGHVMNVWSAVRTGLERKPAIKSDSHKSRYMVAGLRYELGAKVEPSD